MSDFKDNQGRHPPNYKGNNINDDDNDNNQQQ